MTEHPPNLVVALRGRRQAMRLIDYHHVPASAIRPDRAGWDVVVIDEAHRLTPTAQGYYQVGRMLSHGCPRMLLMTATPHRGSEWLFRSLLHLLDPAVFPPA